MEDNHIIVSLMMIMSMVIIKSSWQDTHHQVVIASSEVTRKFCHRCGKNQSLIHKSSMFMHVSIHGHSPPGFDAMVRRDLTFRHTCGKNPNKTSTWVTVSTQLGSGSQLNLGQGVACDQRMVFAETCLPHSKTIKTPRSLVTYKHHSCSSTCPR